MAGARKGTSEKSLPARSVPISTMVEWWVFGIMRAWPGTTGYLSKNAMCVSSSYSMYASLLPSTISQNTHPCIRGGAGMPFY